MGIPTNQYHRKALMCHIIWRGHFWRAISTDTQADGVTLKVFQVVERDPPSKSLLRFPHVPALFLPFGPLVATRGFALLWRFFLSPRPQDVSEKGNPCIGPWPQQLSRAERNVVRVNGGFFFCLPEKTQSEKGTLQSSTGQLVG